MKKKKLPFDTTLTKAQEC